MDQVGVTSSASGPITQVDIRVSSNSDSLLLHWGVVHDSQGYIQHYMFLVISVYPKPF